MQEAKTIGLDGISLIRGRMFTSVATFLKVSVFLCFCTVIAIVPFSSKVSSTEVPNILNYQGNLTDHTGQPLSGTKKITFKLYDAASGGTPFWAEIHPTVLLTEGYFSVVLGSINDLNPDLFTGQTFLGITVESGAEMAPRQRLTSVAYAFKAKEVTSLPKIPDPIPAGIIVMWSGSAENVPSGWALCNGSNGTPDLRNRFVIGAGNTYVVKSTGGEASHTLTLDEIPAHDHVATSSQYTHTHEVSLENKRAQSTNSTSSDRKAWNSPPQGSLQKRTDYIANDTHNHTITINKTGSGKPHNNLPPYFALCFIMKL